MSAELIRELRRLQEYIIQVGDEAVEQKRENKESLQQIAAFIGCR